MSIPGAIYHVRNRGDRREDIFHDDPDRELFLSTLTEACGKTEWQVHAYLEPPAKRPVWLRVDRVLGAMGIPKDSAPGRRQFERDMEERRQQDAPAEYGRIRRGWCLGEEAFRQELLAQVGERRGAEHYGAELAESAEAKAERLVQAGLNEVDWQEGQLAERRKCDPAKVKLAMRVRAETTMTLKWIAARLHMGTWTNLSNLLSQQRRKGS